ncbi:hypothetical protein Pan216_17150 [Planctomycetes bacterium Pan216]|uniref:Uncharacterized protein n=1 Tax=Kolteria novifilia TaxID=2527975 RepID=A0A518B1N6_9BACT|nr:hypothetical protein Pan216_17150 [Planctomycetes bacterium Pan216]
MLHEHQLVESLYLQYVRRELEKDALLLQLHGAFLDGAIDEEEWNDGMHRVTGFCGSHRAAETHCETYVEQWAIA